MGLTVSAGSHETAEREKKKSFEIKDPPSPYFKTLIQFDFHAPPA